MNQLRQKWDEFVKEIYVEPILREYKVLADRVNESEICDGRLGKCLSESIRKQEEQRYKGMHDRIIFDTCV